MPGEARRAGERTMKCRRPEVASFGAIFGRDSFEITTTSFGIGRCGRRQCPSRVQHRPTQVEVGPAPSLYISKKLEVGRGNAARGMSFSS